MATRGVGFSFSNTSTDSFFGGVPDRLNSLSTSLTFNEKLLWSAALALLILDLVTTGFGLQIGLHESNPIAKSLAERFGYWAFGGLKGFSLAIAIGGWAVLSDDYRFIVPICLSVPWLIATVWNTIVIVNSLAS